MASNVIDGLQNYNPLTVLEAITLAKMLLANAFTHNRLSNTHCVVLMAQVHCVTLLPIKNPLSHENKNRHLLEKTITNFRTTRIFHYPHTLQTLHRMASDLMESF